jgi:hypothetical protein
MARAFAVAKSVENGRRQLAFQKDAILRQAAEWAGVLVHERMWEIGDLTEQGWQIVDLHVHPAPCGCPFIRYRTAVFDIDELAHAEGLADLAQPAHVQQVYAFAAFGLRSVIQSHPPWAEACR